MRVLLILLLLILMPGYFFAQEQSGKLAAARVGIERLIAESGAEVVGVAVYDTQNGKMLLINEKISLHAASTMKLPVMMEFFRQANETKTGLEEPVEVKNSFKSIVDGSMYQLNQKDDSDDLVYRWIGNKMPAIKLVDRMITWSSNLATNLMIEKVGAPNVGKLMRNLGAQDIRVLRGVEDTRAFNAGLNNTTTAYDLMLLLKIIAERKFIGRSACDRMIGILTAQHFNQGIPAGLPPGTRVAHKTGEITRHNHDAGIVFPLKKRPYIIVVLTKGLDDRKRSDKLIADISRTVYLALRQ
jgi:beta-lactamase class A